MTPALGNLPPLVPRELGLAFAPIAVWLVLRARAGGPGGWWKAGAAIGLVCRWRRWPVSSAPAGRSVLAVVERTWAAWQALVAAAAVALLAGAAGHRLPPLPRLRLDHDQAPGRAVPGPGAGGARDRAPARPGRAGADPAPGPPRLRRPLVLAPVPLLAVLPVALLTSQASALGTPALERWLRYLPTWSSAWQCPPASARTLPSAPPAGACGRSRSSSQLLLAGPRPAPRRLRRRLSGAPRTPSRCAAPACPSPPATGLR